MDDIPQSLTKFTSLGPSSLSTALNLLNFRGKEQQKQGVNNKIIKKGEKNSSRYSETKRDMKKKKSFTRGRSINFSKINFFFPQAQYSVEDCSVLNTV